MQPRDDDDGAVNCQLTSQLQKPCKRVCVTCLLLVSFIKSFPV
jgi:hypothetical protein